jgi:hypothetical protein
MDYEKLNPLTRIVARDFVRVPQGDFLKRDGIERWAMEVTIFVRYGVP